MNRQEQKVTINLFPCYFAKMIPHKTKPFPYNHRNVSKLRFSNITFKLHNNEVNVKRKAQEETGVYREILSRTIRTIAYIHSATRRYTNCKRLCKQTKLRGWVCADEIYRLPKYDLPGYLQNPGASSLRLKCTKSFEEKSGFFFLLLYKYSKKIRQNNHSKYYF